jgi:hypothetical protein
VFVWLSGAAVGLDIHECLQVFMSQN